MNNMAEATDKFFGICEEMGLKVGKIFEPLKYGGMTVREVEGEFGRYRRSDISGKTYIDFESVDRLDTISMTVEQWRGFLDELHRAARVLGVEL